MFKKFLGMGLALLFSVQWGIYGFDIVQGCFEGIYVHILILFKGVGTAFLIGKEIDRL